jgi:folate-binding protein YgfZ
MPQHHTVISELYIAAKTGAALILRDDRGRVVVSGKDRASYLQGLLTNDVSALEAGQGCYAAYLTAQGRMISDMWVYELGDVILLSLGRDVTTTVLARLDQFIFSEDVQLGDVSDAFRSVAVVGPAAEKVVEAVVPTVGSTVALAALPEHGNVRRVFHGEPVIVLRVTDPGVAGYELVVDAGQMRALLEALHGQGAVDLDAGTVETIRVEAGIPKFHQDMDEETIPLEAGIEGRAISLTKGCYVGQEVIIRVLHRGHGRVAEKLVGMKCSGAVPPAPGAVATADGREVGRVTSSAFSPSLGALALGYLHRDFIAPGTRVAISGADAVVATTPFQPFSEAR